MWEDSEQLNVLLFSVRSLLLSGLSVSIMCYAFSQHSFIGCSSMLHPPAKMLSRYLSVSAELLLLQ